MVGARGTPTLWCGRGQGDPAGSAAPRSPPSGVEESRHDSRSGPGWASTPLRVACPGGRRCSPFCRFSHLPASCLAAFGRGGLGEGMRGIVRGMFPGIWSCGEGVGDVSLSRELKMPYWPLYRLWRQAALEAHKSREWVERCTENLVSAFHPEGPAPVPRTWGASIWLSPGRCWRPGESRKQSVRTAGP